MHSPRKVTVVGSGVFGLTTALSLSTRWSSDLRITIIDKSPFPAADGSSIDSSRIVRADYKDGDYAVLAFRALAMWNANGSGMLGIGNEGRFHKSGMIIVAEGEGEEYVRESYLNVKSLLGEATDQIEELKNGEEIKNALGTGGSSGVKGYLNRTCGWAHAENAMRYLKGLCDKRGNIAFLQAEVVRVIWENSRSMEIVKGVELSDGSTLEADLTILAAGAWTARLIDLTGRAISTGQLLGYLKLAPEEEKRYSKMPVHLDLTTGIAVLPPKNGVLKLLRHAQGYLNTKMVRLNGKEIRISTPRTALTDPGLWIPKEGEDALRKGVMSVIPEFAGRPFERTRICWYTDTPTGDFLVSYIPGTKGLFLATGGNGHAFKFLPVLGDEIVDIIEGKVTQWSKKWRWRDHPAETVVNEDSSRRRVKFQLELAELLGEGTGPLSI